MLDEGLETLIAVELEGLRADRDRLLAARDANPHVDHWKVAGQVAALDRAIGRLEEMLG